MKNIVLILIVFFVSGNLSAQQIANLEGINYQAVAVDHEGKEIVGTDIEGKPLYEKTIGVRFTITADDNGTIYYQEEHETNTDKYGLFSLVIGHGTLTEEGSYDVLLNIPWINGDQWLMVEISIHNDGDYKMVSNQKLMAVPFSFYTDDIADNSITSAKIVDETIQPEDIDTSAVQTSEILDETILAEDIATGAVETSEILDETILAEDIATGAVTTSEILDGTILNEDIANGTIDLTTKVVNVLPVSNGGTGRSSVNSGDILIGNGTGALDTLAITDSVMVFSNSNGTTEVFKLVAGPRTSINVDPVTKTVEISAVDQSGGPNTGSGSVAVPNIISGNQVERNFPAAGVNPGDIILATIDSDLQGLTMTAYVRQAGQVNVIFFNGTNGTVNLGTVNVGFANFGQP